MRASDTHLKSPHSAPNMSVSAFVGEVANAADCCHLSAAEATMRRHGMFSDGSFGGLSCQ